MDNILVANYKVLILDRDDPKTGNTAKIHLRNEKNQPIGTIYFYAEKSRLPDNRQFTNFKPPRTIIHTHESKLQSMIDLLRNEKPCYLYYVSKTLGGLSTTEEPVGEEETEQ
ncbi:MAG: hypothetical protein OEM28_01010 [Nitrosopumilus sp.]|nr:hypothetical protein [Nitrosopumilus sp.]MDH3486444.1 hypothetical protein [Nitrosopumilus sp.]